VRRGDDPYFHVPRGRRGIRKEGGEVRESGRRAKIHAKKKARRESSREDLLGGGGYRGALEKGRMVRQIVDKGKSSAEKGGRIGKQIVGLGLRKHRHVGRAFMRNAVEWGGKKFPTTEGGDWEEQDWWKRESRGRRDAVGDELRSGELTRKGGTLLANADTDRRGVNL